jgi:hypothetical protein
MFFGYQAADDVTTPIEHLASLLGPREPELGADCPVAAAPRALEVPAVNNQLVMRALLEAREAID